MQTILEVWENVWCGEIRDKKIADLQYPGYFLQAGACYYIIVVAEIH